MTTTPAKVLAPRYMSRFACIGSACEDSCCQGWNVHIDQGHLGRIRHALREEPAERARFDAAVELMPAPVRTKGALVRLKLLPDGNCPMLDADRMCALQQRHGEEVLPDICAVFPRAMVDLGQRMELTATLGCPEVARLALLAPDATELVELGPEVLRRTSPSFVTRLDKKVLRTTVPIVTRVRDRMHALLGRGEFPLRSRLYFTIELLNQLRPVRADGPAAAQILESFDDTDLLRRLHEHFQGQRPRLGTNVRPLVAILSTLWQQAPEAPFSRLSLAILRSYLPPAEQQGAEFQLPMEQLLTEYQRRQDAVLDAMSLRVDLYFQNYARHMWIKDMGQQLKGFDRYLRQQLMRVILLRFLLLSHPQAVAAAADPEGGEAALDRLAVQLIYSFSRSIDSNTKLSGDVDHLAAEQVPDLGAMLVQLAL